MAIGFGGGFQTEISEHIYTNSSFAYKSKDTVKLLINNIFFYSKAARSTVTPLA